MSIKAEKHLNKPLIELDYDYKNAVLDHYHESLREFVAEESVKALYGGATAFKHKISGDLVYKFWPTVVTHPSHDTHDSDYVSVCLRYDFENFTDRDRHQSLFEEPKHKELQITKDKVEKEYKVQVFSRYNLNDTETAADFIDWIKTEAVPVFANALKEYVNSYPEYEFDFDEGTMEPKH